MVRIGGFWEHSREQAGYGDGFLVFRAARFTGWARALYPTAPPPPLRATPVQLNFVQGP